MIEPKEIGWVIKEMRAKSKEEFAALGMDHEDVARMALGADLAFCVYHKSLPAAIYGAWQDHPGVWECFGFGTDHWIDEWRYVTVSARRNMMKKIEETGAHRVQCMSPAHHEDTHDWLRFLGLKYEVDMPKYGVHGEDFKMFAWLRG